MNNTRAWSEETEKAYRIGRWLSWLAVLIGFVYLCVSVAMLSAVGIFVGVVIAVAGACMDATIKIWQHEMAFNRPYHGTAGLTRWTWHNAKEESVQCPCGEKRTWKDVPFVAMEMDPGGGRFSFVCKCARGHYKFAADTAPRY